MLFKFSHTDCPLGLSWAEFTTTFRALYWITKASTGFNQFVQEVKITSKKDAFLAIMNFDCNLKH